ncbi:MAG: type I-E CRISPR-associated protein Cas5/CasD [Gemmatimonadaceae bacterium]
MSTDIAHLALRLVGPMQSWGCESQYSRRNTGRFPTKSALAGLLCAALGVPRGSERERNVLEAVRRTKLLVVAIPRLAAGSGNELPYRRLLDYHTVQGSVTAEVKGKVKETHLTYRQYLNDAAFGIVLSAEYGFLAELGRALDDPKWGLWLGRKACIPAEPVLAGLFDSEQAALDKLLNGRRLRSFAHQRDVELFEDGADTLPDLPVSFDSNARVFAPRRVQVFEPGAE